MQPNTTSHHYERRSSTKFTIRTIGFTQKEEKQMQYSPNNNEQENQQQNFGLKTVRGNSLKTHQNGSQGEALMITTNHSKYCKSSLQRKIYMKVDESQSPLTIPKRKNNIQKQYSDQLIRHQTKSIVKNVIKMAIQLPFSKEVLSAQGSIINGEVVIKGAIVDLQYELVDQEVNKLQKGFHQTIQFLEKFDILTPNISLNRKEMRDITGSQMNRLILGYGFFKQSIPSIGESEMKSIQRFLTSNCPMLVTEIDRIRNSHKMSTLTSFYVLTHVLAREGKLNVYKLLSSFGNYIKTSQILKSISQRQFQIHAEWSIKYHHFILQQRLQFVRWFKRMLKRRRWELDEKLGKQGVQRMILEILDDRSYQNYTSLQRMNNGIKLIQYLNQTLNQVISSIGYQQRRHQSLIFSSAISLLNITQNRYKLFSPAFSDFIQQMKDQLYQIYYIPLFHQFDKLKTKGKLSQFLVDGNWKVVIEYFHSKKQDSDSDLRFSVKQKERRLVTVFKALGCIPNITATLDNIVHLQNKVQLFKPERQRQQFPRLQTLELLLLLRLFQKYQFNKHKVFKRKSDSLNFNLKPQEQQQTYNQIQAALNKLFDELMNSVVSLNKTLPITFLLFYVYFNQQTSKNLTEKTYILNVDPLHICSILNSFFRKQGQLPDFNRISQLFVNVMFGNNATINQIRNDVLFIHCFQIFENTQVQLNTMKNKCNLFNLEKCFLSSLNIMFQQVKNQIKNLKLNSGDTQEKIAQLLKKLADEQKPTIQQLQRRYYAKQYLKVQYQEKKTSDVLIQNVLFEFNIKFMRKVLKVFRKKQGYSQRDKQTTKLIKDILKNIYDIIIGAPTKKLESKTMFEQDQWKKRILKSEKLINIVSQEYRKMLIDDRVNKWGEKSDKQRVFSQLFLLVCDMTNCHLFMIDGDMIINKRQNDPLVVFLRVRKAWSDIKSVFQHPRLNQMLKRVFPLEQKPTVDAFKTSLTYLNLIFSKVILPSLGDCQNFLATKPIIHEMIDFMGTLKEKIIDPFRIDEFTTSHVLQVLYCQQKVNNSNDNDIEMQETIFKQTTIQCFKFLDHLLLFYKIVNSSNLPQSHQMLKIIPKDAFPSEILSQISQNLLLIQFLDLVKREELFKKYKVHEKIRPLIEIYLKFSIKQRSTNKIWQQIMNEMHQKERQEIQNFVKKEVCKKFFSLKKASVNQQNNNIETNNLRNFFQLVPFSRLIELIKVIHRLPVRIYKNPEDQRLLSLGLLNNHHDQKFIKDIKTKSMIHRLNYIAEYSNVLKLESLPSIMNKNGSIIMGKQKMNRMGQLTEICENFTSFFLQQIQIMVSPFQQFTIVKKYGFDLIKELGIIQALECIQKYNMHIKSLIVIMKFLGLNIFINDILWGRVEERILDESNYELDCCIIRVIKQMNEKILANAMSSTQTPSLFCTGLILLLPLLRRTVHISQWSTQRSILASYQKANISLRLIQQLLSSEDNSMSFIFLRLQSIHYQFLSSQQHNSIIQSIIPVNVFAFDQLFEVIEYLAMKYFTELIRCHVGNITQYRQGMEGQREDDSHMSVRFSTKFLQPSTCQTLNIFLSHYLTIFRQSYLYKRCVVDQKRLFRILVHFLNVIQICYQMLMTNLDSTQYKTQIVYQHQLIYQQLYDKILTLKQTLMHFASFITQSQQESIQGRQSLYSDLYIYISKIITDYHQKRISYKGYQIGVKFPVYKQCQNTPKYHRGYEIMTYTRLSKIVQTRRLKRENQFDIVYMLFMQGVRKLPQLKLIASKQTIRGFNILQQFLNSFIVFLSNNQVFRPSSQVLTESFHQVLTIIDYWQVAISEIKLQQMQLYLLAWMKLITQITIIILKVIRCMRINIPSNQTFKQVQSRLSQSIHVFLVRVLSSEVFICFANFIINKYEINDRKMIRFHEAKIIYSVLVDLIAVVIDRKLITRELLEMPLYEFKCSNQMCKQAKKAKFDQSNLVNLIEINIIKPITKLIAMDHTQIHISKDNSRPSLDRFGVQSIVESQKIIMNTNKEGYHDMTHLVASEMSYFKFVDCLTTLEIGEKLINTIKKIINIVQRQHIFLEYLAMNSNHIKRILKNAKIFFCTFSNPSYDLKMQKVQFKEFIKNTEQKLVQIINILRKFVYNSTQMRVQVNCFLLNDHKSLKIKNISKIWGSIVKMLSTFQQMNENQNQQYSNSEYRFFNEIYDYLMADEIRKAQLKAQRRKEERFKNFVKNQRIISN